MIQKNKNRKRGKRKKRKGIKTQEEQNNDDATKDKEEKCEGKKTCRWNMKKKKENYKQVSVQVKPQR